MVFMLPLLKTLLLIQIIFITQQQHQIPILLDFLLAQIVMDIMELLLKTEFMIYKLQLQLVFMVYM